MSTILRNLHYALRQLRKSPVFTIAAVLTLALGIGATTAIYTVVYATLIAPMPYPNPDQLVIVWSKIQGFRNGVSAGDFLDWQEQNTSFQALKAFTGTSFNMAGKEAPEMVRGQMVTPGMYNMLGNRFALGRDLLPEEGVDGKDHVVVLMNKLWKRLGADPDIVGKQIKLDQKPYTVVGVLGAGQADRLDQDVIVPLVFKPEQKNHDFHWMLVMGRLKPGVTLKQAQSDMDAVTARIAQVNPRSNKGWAARVDPLQNDFLGDNVKLTLWLLLGAVGCVLLIACVNVANLLLARGTSRTREISIRSAVGATRTDVFIQFVTESLVLAFLGGAVGVAMGYAMLHGLIAAMPQGTLPSEADLSLNRAVLAVTLAATTLSGILFGCAPAWYASRLDPADTLKEGGRSGSSKVRHRVRQALVVGEFTLALALLAGAGLAMHSFWNLAHVDLGVQTDHTLTFALPMSKGADLKPEQIIGYYQQILRSIESTTGVESASGSTGLPLQGAGFGMPFTISGQSEFADRSQRPTAGFGMVTSDYFKTFGVHLAKGRFFTEGDNAGNLHVAVVNEQLVRHWMPGKDPIGRTLNVEQLVPGVQKLGPEQPWVIVGVYHDVRGGGFESQREEILVPFAQSSWPFIEIGVRTARDPEAMTKTISKAVHTVDPNIALSDVKTLDQIRDEDLSGERFSLVLYASFALIALVLAVIGIYGVMAFSVGQREHEIGLRMALGASRDRVVGMILREGAMLAGIGMVLGLAGAYFVGRAMKSTLYNVGSIDLSAFCAVSAILLVSALIACYVPARRAAAVDPMRALRTE
ncbi:MAG TPA: ABC transporter permease [Terracidiphilus sp.]|jgi:putative ABC transport system permease protein|nr:ABC transporter permease [Terracidiphilus sp.]